MHLQGKPVCSFDPEGLIFAAGVNSEMVKLYDLRSFDKVRYPDFSSYSFYLARGNLNSVLRGWICVLKLNVWVPPWHPEFSVSTHLRDRDTNPEVHSYRCSSACSWTCSKLQFRLFVVQFWPFFPCCLLWKNTGKDWARTVRKDGNFKGNCTSVGSWTE